MPEEQKIPQQDSPFEIVTPQKPKKLTAKNAVLIAVVLLFLGISVFLGVYLVGKQTNVEQKAAPATAIYITPGSQTKAAGDSFTFFVNMDTSVNSVTGVDVRLNFDPAVMQVVSIQQGSGITNLNQTITNTYDNTAGKISYAVFTLDSSKAVTGSDIEVLRVNAQLKSNAPAGSSNITFDPATAASASQEGQNVLVSKSQGVVVVSAASTAVPTPTATSSPTPTATAQATATAKSQSSPTPTPTATATSSTSGSNLNSCGGTCGSNNNCVSNLVCYQGFCRNPSCPSDSTCGCSASQPTGTQTSNSVQTSPLPIPESGTDWPTMAAFGLGLITIIISVFAAL